MWKPEVRSRVMAEFEVDGSREWIRGTVLQLYESTGFARVKFDDGDTEKIPIRRLKQA
jgi:hypothetical protein